MRSRSDSLVASFLVLCCLALPSRALAGYGSAAAAPRVGAPWIQIYAAGSSDMGRISGESALGYGISLLWRASDRWSLGMSATRLSHGRENVTPLALGFAYGPKGPRTFRPWFEAGVSYYRFTATAAVDNPLGLASSGNPRDLFPNSGHESVSSRAAGGYFGLAAERTLTSHLGLTAGARGYFWGGRSGSHGWDGLAEGRAGLSYRF
ncbi:MAG TPA: hypothetical protein VL503_02710 [Candidatus Omnitrophota bacterium]|jgi:hypothetical protein|nr:hypothetical protein [Candidatus Omnitrophota bacterium]